MSAELILVAEDNREIAQIVEEKILRPAGYQVRCVGDGMSALTLAQDLKPDLVITDQQMPGLAGLDLIRRLRTALPGTPTILMSSEGSDKLILAALRAGACDFLVKPFASDELLQAVRRALENRSEGRDKDEGSLARRVQELETLAMIGRTVTAVLDLDVVLTTVVEAAVRLTGAEEGSLLLVDGATGELYMRASKNFDEDFAHTFRLQVQDSLAGQVLEKGEPILLDESSPQKIKTAYLVHSLIYVPLQVRGKTIGVLGVDNRKAGKQLTREDVTLLMAMADYAAIAVENARLYQESEAERAKFETVLGQSQNGVIVVDEENCLLLANRSAQEIFGLQGNILGRSAAEVFDHAALLELLREPGGSTRRDDIELEDGRVLAAVRSPIRGVGHAVILHDITHLKELDRIKSEFVTTVSHDLRSPLTAILGYTELIERAGPLTEVQAQFLSRVRMSVEQITALVTDLLDLGRIEAGLDTTKEDTPLATLAGYAVESIRALADAKGLELEAKLENGLPHVHGDPLRLRQMIGNLLENAIKYTPTGGRVCLEAGAEGDQIILQVSDTGPGIPPADQPYLFDKFFRASNIPNDAPGTGLGLSIVKSIVEQHNGRIWVDSRLGEGTTFTVVLPAIRD